MIATENLEAIANFTNLFLCPICYMQQHYYVLINVLKTEISVG